MSGTQMGWVAVVCLVIYPCLLYGQQEQDSILLEGITIQAQSYDKYANGSRVTRLDNTAMSTSSAQRLSDVLQANTPLYIRSRGNHMLSTLSFRGTSPSQTAILWNGININVPSLGQSDLSLIPTHMIDEIAIHHGPGSSLYGSDAIGGSVHLNSKRPTEKGLSGTLQQGIASFASYQSNIQLSYGTEKWSSRSRFYRFSSKNNFPYTNTTRADQREERQENAAVQQYGFLQEFFFQPKERMDWSAGLWFNHADREVQSSMLSPGQNNWQVDQSLRGYLRGLAYFEHSFLEWQSAYTSDWINYNGSASQMQKVTQRLVYDWHPADKSNGLSSKLSQVAFNIKMGAEWSYFHASIDQYQDGFAEEHRQDLFFLSTWKAWKGGRWSFNIRQAMVAGEAVPLTPHLGLEQEVLTFSVQSLRLKTSGGRSYRVPTLNDRFWVPGGSPNLLPEDSWGLEVGGQWQWKKNQGSLESELTFFSQWIDQWIVWLPQPEGFWQAKNVREVNTRGMEASLKGQLDLGDHILRGNAMYSFTRAEIIRAEPSLGSPGMQLAYTPLHNTTSYFSYEWNKWILTSQWNYTGMRFTTLSNDRRMEAFQLLDFHLSKELPWKAKTFLIRASLFNASNTVYQNMAFLAMPGRNYRLELSINF